MPTSLFHINPTTGNPGRCRALYRCPFGSSEHGHYATAEEAREAYENFEKGLTTPEKSLPFVFLSDEELDDFANGDCGHLAYELHRKTGWPLLLVAGNKTFPEPGKVDLIHVAVRSPDGRILDVEGLWTPADFKHTWSNKGKYPEYELDAATYKSLKMQERIFPTSPVKTANKILKLIRAEV